ncbi:hypothetical protein [Mycolicibacterium sp. P1-18]|nr:hypothetical protein [Mycolicibacterium sp. P1-18]
MPKGSGIYEDEPREHQTTYSPEPGDDPQDANRTSTSDDTSSEDAGEPTG